MSSSPQSLSQKIPGLLVLVCVFGVTLWYCWDAYQASDSIQNLILILPVSCAILGLCLLQFVRDVSLSIAEHEDSQPFSEVIPVIILFTGYVLLLPWLGFDVGTFLFLSLFLWFHGERRVGRILIFSLTFALLVALFFSNMLPYPMPMLLLPTDY